MNNKTGVVVLVVVNTDFGTECMLLYIITHISQVSSLTSGYFCTSVLL